MVTQVRENHESKVKLSWSYAPKDYHMMRNHMVMNKLLAIIIINPIVFACQGNMLLQNRVRESVLHEARKSTVNWYFILHETCAQMHDIT